MTTPEPVSPAPTGSVVLCGSLDPARVASLAAAADWYRANVNSGTAVHVPTRDPSVPPEEHARRWYALIEQADRVVVVTDPSGYIGEQTAREQAYAVQQGCDVVVEAWQPAMRVTPTPDTEALRQQVAAIASGYLHACPHCPKDKPEWVAGEDQVHEIVAQVVAEREATHAEVARTWEAYRLRSVEQKREWRRKVTAAEEEIERLRAELAGARTIPDDAVERVTARRLPEVHASPNCACGYNFAGTAFVDPLCEKFLDGNRHEATPITGPAPALEQTNSSHAGSSGTTPQRFPVAAVQTNAGPAPAAADGLREEYAGFFHPAWPDPLHFQYGDNPHANAARWYAEHVEQQPQIEVRRRVLSDWVTVDVTVPAAPQSPAEPTKKLATAAHPRNHSLGTHALHDCGGDPKCCGDPDAEAAREDTAPPDDDCKEPAQAVQSGAEIEGPDGYNDNLTAGFLRAPVGACSCRPTAAVIHVPGTYCGDTQHEQAVDAMRAKTGRPGDERDEEAVSAVLGYLANPTPEEKQ